MVLCDREHTFKFGWQPGWSFQRLHEEFECLRRAGAFDSDSRARVLICYITTQKRRLYLVQCNTGLRYLPYRLDGTVWKPLFEHEIVTKDVAREHVASEETLYETLEFQLILQFRTVVHGYYEDPPCAGDIQEMLPKRATVGDLRNAMLTVYDAVVQRDPEWDGAVEVMCEGGMVLYPYVRAGASNRDDYVLLTKYRTFVPGSAMESAGGVWGRICDGVLSFLDNLHWSNFRNMVEGIGGNKT